MSNVIHHDLNATEAELVRAKEAQASLLLQQAQAFYQQAQALVPNAYRTILSVYGEKLSGKADVDWDDGEHGVLTCEVEGEPLDAEPEGEIDEPIELLEGEGDPGEL